MFAVTLFVSAFLLFLVQPMIGKMILPRLGGTPQVWNTCMVFFQAALLAGYAYTHTISTRLSLRRQLLLHGAVLFVPLALLLARWLGTENHNPFSVAEFLPPPGANPIPYTLFQLLILVGLPFFVVSTSAPLLQKWFANTGHPSAKDPYFLYGASNLGSLLALVAYPFVVEPNLLLQQQGVTWAVGYGVLLVLVLICAAMAWQAPPAVKLSFAGEGDRGNDSTRLPAGPALEGPGGGPTAPTSTAAPQATAIKKAPKHGLRPGAYEPAVAEAAPRVTEEITTWRRLRWIGLGAVPTSLMLGITTHITTDLSPVALIWLLPLILYLLSFIIVFSRWPVVWTAKPHTIMLYLHPLALGAMILMDFIATQEHWLGTMVFFLALGFWWTAMVCHGELARDRPNTKHLTEFYLWMSVGGVVGGIFNGLMAPVMFPRVWEYPIALTVAAFLRPTMRESGWLDDLLSSFMGKSAPQPAPTRKGGKQQPRTVVKQEENPSFPYFVDVAVAVGVLVLTLLLAFALRGVIDKMAASAPRDSQRAASYSMMFGIPLLLCCFMYGRPVRFGLSLGAVLLLQLVYVGEGRGTIWSGRSYFGVIKVIENVQFMPSAGGEEKRHRFTQLLHGTTDHGMNLEKPGDPKLVGNPLEDYSRLATTYYHQLGPAGRGMEKFNWFDKNKVNYYHSDARMPASLAALGALSAGPVNLPVGQLTDLWSEPPYATIGLGTGTMASYARPYQHCHFYEIDNAIRRLSLPVGGLENYFRGDKMPQGKSYFTYLHSALKRGANVQVLMGDARLRMAQPYESYYAEPLNGGGPDNFYHLMVVDAFSSDAIPVHLITKQALQMYFKKLTPDGLLCVHTSNRHVDLVKVVADTAASISFSEEGDERKIVYSNNGDKTLVWKRGHDQAPGGREQGHYTSEWVMVARDLNRLNDPSMSEPPNYMQLLQQEVDRRGGRVEPYWDEPPASGGRRFVWTDDYSNLIAVLRESAAPMFTSVFVVIGLIVVVIVIISKTSPEVEPVRRH
jgi:hypothetical protein